MKLAKFPNQSPSTNYNNTHDAESKIDQDESCSYITTDWL